MAKEITTLVSQLLTKHKIDKAPIPVERIVKSLGITLRHEPFNGSKGSVSGMLFRDDDGKTVIGVNNQESKTRQRFTIGHELGHFILHQQKVYVETASEIFFRNELSSKAVDPNEVEANQFAAELLMPAQIVRDEFKQEYDDHVKRFKSAPLEYIIEELADKFEVSGQSMTFRLANLGIISIN